MTTDWLIGVAFLVVTEILYFSLCHNFEDKKETIIADLLVVKFMSMFLSVLILAVGWMIWDLISRITWETLVWIGQGLAIVAVIGAYFAINVWLGLKFYGGKKHGKK